MRRYREAVSCYETTESLVPAWYHCCADRWLAKRLASEALDHEVFLAVRATTDAGLPPGEIVLLAQSALKRAEARVMASGSAGSELGASRRRGRREVR